ncbi:MAG: LytR/AlgR family response regulator transcription factor [Syntrophomonadaceae bacterium]
MKKRILIIEDEDEILDNIKILLEAENYDVLSANTGELGISTAREYLPDLIISDIMMPGIDGYGVFRQLSEFEETTAIPFIFLTAKAEYKDLRKGMELGADDYLLKPFNSSDLLSAVKTRLDKYQAIRAKLLSENSASDSTEEVKLGPEDNILIYYHNSTIPVKIKKIRYIAAENQYTRIVLDDNRKFIMRKSLAQWEAILPENIFVRIHRSTIINLAKVDRMEKQSENKYKVFLNRTDETFEISRRYKKNIKNKI